MRIVLHNPHCDNWYKTPVYYFLTRRKSIKKYEYILDYIIKEKIDFCFYIDSSNTSIAGRKLRKFFPPSVEFILWALLNKINISKYKIIRNIDNLKKNDVLISFLYRNFTSQSGSFISPRKIIINDFARCQAFKVIHLTHYMYNVGLGAKNAKEANINLFVAENNLKKNSHFYNHYFGWYNDDVYVLPFVPKDRYKKLTNFASRKNKAIATGTLTHPMRDNDFINYFKHHKVHPMRYEIYEKRKQISEYVDSYISEMMEGKKWIENPSNNLFKYIYEVIYSLSSGKQKKYFSFDIVQKMNEYKMFIVPEEVNDLPGISFVEGMACGSAYIGLKNAMYEDLGMKDKIHYIGYDGTLEDLIKKIGYYQSNNSELEVIAANGYELTRNIFNKSIVAKNFFSELEKILNIRMNYSNSE